jgi:metal-responsive CopG/Arc/MetJ family transcriptional regulator
MAHNTLGETKSNTFRLSSETVAQLDAIAAHYGLSNRSEAVRFLAAQAAKRIAKTEGKGK